MLAGGGLVQGGPVAQFGQAGDAGEGCQGGDEGGVGPGLLRFRIRSGNLARSGQDEVAQPAVVRVAVDIAVFEVFDLLVADLGAGRVGGVVAHGGDLQALAGGGGGDAVHDGVVELVSGGDWLQVRVMWQNSRCSILFHLRGAGPMPLLVSCELSFRELTSVVHDAGYASVDRVS